MNPGDTLPLVEDREGGLGRALHDRLAHLAARLERLTSEAAPRGAEEARADLNARLDAFAAAPRGPSASPSRSAGAFASAASAEDGRTMDAIAAALRDLGEPAPAETARPQPVVEPFQRPTPEDRLRTIRDRIEQIKLRHGLADPEPEAVADAMEEPPFRPEPQAFAPLPPVQADRRYEDEFADIAAHLREPPPPPAPAPMTVVNLSQAIAEISARQRLIDDPGPAPLPPPLDRRASPPLQSPDRPLPAGASRPPQRLPPPAAAPSPARPPAPPAAARPPAPAATDGLTAEVANLRQDLAALTRLVAEGGAGAGIAAVGREVEAIRGLLESTALGTTLSSIEAGYGHILERLDAIDRRAGAAEEIQAIAQDLLHRMPTGERFDILAAEIDRLAESVTSSDHRTELMRIEARLAAIDGRVAAGATARSAIGVAGSDPAASARMETDVAATRRAVEALSQTLQAGGSPALVRIEQRLADMSARLESALSEAPKADSVSNLFERLDRLASRGETAPAALEALAGEIAGLRERERTELASLDRNIAALASRLDAAVSARGTAPEIEARIGELSDRLADLSTASPTPERLRKIEQIETQVSDLAGRFDNLTGDVLPDALAQLEGQMSSLVSRIDAEPARAGAIQQVEANLARLEGVVEDTKRQSTTAMQDAARAAIRELSGMTGLRQSETTIVDALKADLDDLQAAVRNTSRRSADDLDSVHGTLDKVVERLTRLEAETRSEAPRAALMPAAPALAAPAPAIVETPGATAAQRLRGLAPIDENRDRPIEPGAWRPQPEPEAPAAPKSERDRKADFIAAARRAAQAAATEHASMRPLAGSTRPADAGPRAPSQAGSFVAANRRPLLLAAAAIVLAIAVVTVLKPFSGRGEAEPPANTTPAAAAETTEVPSPPALAAIEDAPALGAAGPVAAEPPAVQPPVGDLPGFAAPAAPASPAFVAADPIAAAEAAAVEPMPPEAVGSTRLRLAAAAGDPSALYEVGARYAEGRNVDRNSAEAALWFERAAARGLAAAQYRLGTMYEGGVGVAQDRAEALTWYLSAAAQGNVQAMHNLGVLLSQGVAGTPDFSGAIEWFTAAAEHGVRDSQYNLGVIYARGIGVAQDLILSYQWFAVAALQGDTDAAGRRDEVAATLSADQLATARALVSAWSVTVPDAAANTVTVPEGGWDDPGPAAALDDATLVRTIQAALTERGFDAGPADGTMGPRTREAIRAFQAMIGANATGEIDPTVMAALGIRA